MDTTIKRINLLVEILNQYLPDITFHVYLNRSLSETKYVSVTQSTEYISLSYLLSALRKVCSLLLLLM